MFGLNKILPTDSDYQFMNIRKKMLYVSLFFIIISALLLVFKGLNLGIDFKGGTLIELRTENPNINIAEIRQSFLKMNLGDITVKKFGK